MEFPLPEGIPLQRGGWHLDKPGQVGRRTECLAVGGDPVQVDIRRQVKLPVSRKSRYGFTINGSGVAVCADHTLATISHTCIEPGGKVVFGRQEGFDIDGKPIGLAIVVLQCPGDPVFSQFLRVVGWINRWMIREFERNPLLMPECLLTCEKRGTDDIGRHITLGKPPFGRKTIQHFDDGHIAQRCKRPDGNGGIVADPTPSHQVKLYGPDVIGRGGMSQLINLQPFPVVIKKMESAPWVFPVPQIIEAGGNQDATGNFRGHHRLEPVGVVLGRRREEYLLARCFRYEQHQKNGKKCNFQNKVSGWHHEAQVFGFIRHPPAYPWHGRCIVNNITLFSKRNKTQERFTWPSISKIQYLQF